MMVYRSSTEWEGWLGFCNLENRCLVEMVENDFGQTCLRMHDHLRDLGRDIAKNEPTLRLWRPTHTHHHLSDQSLVRGISTLQKPSDGKYAPESFQSLAELARSRFVTNRLQLLRAEGYSVKSILSVAKSPQLMWLCWYNCSYKTFLPSSIPLENLRVLNINWGKLKRLWRNESQAPLQLRELVIDARRMKVPESIGKLKHLEKLVVRVETLDITFSDEFCHLQSLKHLELAHCNPEICCLMAESLPDCFGSLTNLQYILLNFYTLQTLPNSFGNLTNLQHIDLCDCSNLYMLPDSFGNLRNLQHLNLRLCVSLQKLPDSFGNLTSLEHIELSFCEDLQKLPDSFGNLANLRYIYMQSCCLQKLSDSFGDLKSLRYLTLWCSNLKMLPKSFGNLRNLRHFCLYECSLPNSSEFGTT